jgi:hypothetical protein
MVAPPGRYYLGLGGAVGSYAQSRVGAASVLAPTLTGGLRLTPRLALEVSLLVHRSGFDQSGHGVYVDTLGGASSLKPAVFRSYYLNRTQVLSLAARYTLWQPRASRFSLDALGGLALVHSDAYGYNATLDQATGQPVKAGACTCATTKPTAACCWGPAYATKPAST